MVGKVAIVTSARTVEPDRLNVGGATATELATHGIRVVLADINVEGANRLTDQINWDSSTLNRTVERSAEPVRELGPGNPQLSKAKETELTPGPVEWL